MFKKTGTVGALSPPVPVSWDWMWDKKRIGVAVSDRLGWTAQGVGVIDRTRPDWMKRLAELIEENEVGAIVVGLPRNMDGSIGPGERRARSWPGGWRNNFPPGDPVG